MHLLVVAGTQCLLVSAFRCLAPGVNGAWCPEVPTGAHKHSLDFTSAMTCKIQLETL